MLGNRDERLAIYIDILHRQTDALLCNR